MKTLKLSTLVFTLVCGAWLGCGDSGGTPAGTGGSIGKGGALGTGGVIGTGGAVDGGGGMGGAVYDAPMGGSEVGPGQEAGGQGGTSGITCGATGYVDCTGLTPAQCHDLIINPPTIEDCVVSPVPGANPPVLYPNCSAQ